MEFLFGENRSHGTDEQRDARGATFNVAHKEGHIAIRTHLNLMMLSV